MVDFRKAILLLAVLVMATGIVSAQALNCTLNGGAPPLLRAEGVAEEVGQVLIVCTGGTPTPAGQNIPKINVRIFTNGYNITSKLLGNGALEASLLIDDPIPAAQILAAFPTPGTVIADGGSGYPAGTPNVYLSNPGTGNPQSIEWRDVPFNPPGTTRIIRIVNLRVNAALATGGNVSSLIPPPVNLFVSVTGTLTLPITSPFLTVGFIQNGLKFSTTSSTFRQCQDPTSFDVMFTELFPNAFRIQNSLGLGACVTAGDPGCQDNLNTIYNTESMFYGPVYGGLGAGMATQATRLKVTFTNIPNGVALAVPVTISSGAHSATLVPIGTDGSTANQSTGSVALSGGAGAAVWEIVTADAGVTITLTATVSVSYTVPLPDLGSGSVWGSYAPLSTQDTWGPLSSLQPRFFQNPTATTSFTIVPCETRLLFPFVTSIPGWDTGIAISNTTVDPFGTPAEKGACTLWFYGTANTNQTSTEIAAGSQLLMTMVGGNAAQNLNAVSNFTGYMIAVCQFQYAHGYAFISDLGANKFAQGYLALIIGYNDGSFLRDSNPSEDLNQ